MNLEWYHLHHHQHFYYMPDFPSSIANSCVMLDLNSTVISQYYSWVILSVCSRTLTFLVLNQPSNLVDQRYFTALQLSLAGQRCAPSPTLDHYLTSLLLNYCHNSKLHFVNAYCRDYLFDHLYHRTSYWRPDTADLTPTTFCLLSFLLISKKFLVKFL